MIPPFRCPVQGGFLCGLCIGRCVPPGQDRLEHASALMFWAMEASGEQGDALDDEAEQEDVQEHPSPVTADDS